MPIWIKSERNEWNQTDMAASEKHSISSNNICWTTLSMLYTSQRSSFVLVLQLECLRKWREGRNRYVIARPLGDVTALAACYVRITTSGIFNYNTFRVVSYVTDAWGMQLNTSWCAWHVKIIIIIIIIQVIKLLNCRESLFCFSGNAVVQSCSSVTKRVC